MQEEYIMRKIGISDQTLYTSAARGAGFRQKLEAARKLDHLGLDTVEVPRLSQDEADMLLMRSLCGVVKRSVLACQTGFTRESVERAWDAVKGAAKPRLIVAVPVTSAQMEYTCHLKPPKVIEMIGRVGRNHYDLLLFLGHSAKSLRVALGAGRGYYDLNSGEIRSDIDDPSGMHNLVFLRHNYFLFFSTIDVNGCLSPSQPVILPVAVPTSKGASK